MIHRSTLNRTLTCVSLALFLCACGEVDDDIDIVHDPCEPLTISARDATPEQQESIAAAIELWNEQGTELQLAESLEPEAVQVGFEDAAPMFKGIYRDEIGDVVINSRLSESDERTIVIAHEFGHAFGLEHVEPEERTSLMNSGNTESPPGPGDVEALQGLWPDCDLQR